MNIRKAVACLIFAAAVWAGWPLLTLATYPHVTQRAFLAIFLMGMAAALVRD